MGKLDSTTRRSLLATVAAGGAAGIVATGASAQVGPNPDRRAGRDRDRTDIRILNCRTAVVRTRDTAAEYIYAGLYFRESGNYDFHQAAVNFPHVLNLRRFDWARRQDAVLTRVTVQDVDFDDLASKPVPPALGCEADGENARG